MERAEAPNDSYSLAFEIASKFSLITPALGEAFFISAMIALDLFSRFFLKLLCSIFSRLIFESNSLKGRRNFFS